MLAVIFVFTVFALSSVHGASAMEGNGHDKELPFQTDGDMPGVIHIRSLQQAAATDCIWDGARCNLRRDFVGGLPAVLGSPTTDSAKLLADAALRAAVCSNVTGKPACLTAPSYSCDWDMVLDRCTLGDILEAPALRGVAYCTGSRLDVALSCAARPSATCESDPALDCILLADVPLLPLRANAGSGSSASLQGLPVAGFADLGAAVAGDRQMSAMLGSMLGTMIKYGLAGLADPLSQLITGALKEASGAVPTAPQVCAARWLVDSAALPNLGNLLMRVLQADADLLSALLSAPDLAGSCNASAPLLAAAATCRDAGTAGGAAACAAAAPVSGAAGGCQWVAEVGSCALGPEVLPALRLDPSDRWVSVLRNATALCRSFKDAATCGAVTNVTATALLTAGGVAGSGGDGGGSAAAAAASWWLLGAAAVAAVAVGNVVRRA